MSLPQRGGFNFHRPFLSLPHTLELEEGERQEETDTAKRLPMDKEENSKVSYLKNASPQLY